MNKQQTLNLYPIDYPFETLVHRVEKGKLILNPDFQRSYKWDKDGNIRASRFIESCLMRIPLPACYFYEDLDKNHIVIDGVQRITTIKNFINNKFALEGLTIFTELNGKKFDELALHRNDLENYTIRCVVLRNDNPPELVRDIFARLNEGSVILAPQEIRHAVYEGNLNNLLHELSADERIQNFGKGKKGKKEKHSQEAEEQILRFFAFSEDLDSYEDNLKQHLDNYMQKNQHINNELCQKKKKLFLKTLDKCFLVFGNDSFIDTTKERPKQSLVYFDLLMKDFSNREYDFLEQNSDEIRDLFIEFCNKPEIKRTLSGGVLLKSRITLRENVWKELMDAI